MSYEMNVRKRARKRKRILPAAILMALLLVGALFAFSLNVGAAHAQEGEVAETTARLNFREGPGLDATLIRTLPVGAEVTFTGFRNETGDWVQVRAADGATGWVFAQFLSNVPAGLEPAPAAEEAPVPSITPADQAIGADGSVVVPQIVADQSGWVVIHRDDGGSVGAVIGHAAVAAGTSNDVAVTVDTAQVTERLYAMLHVDAGQAGAYEFPGADVPVTVDDGVVVNPFTVTNIAELTGDTFSADVVTANTTVNLNLRTGPGLNFEIIETLPQGTQVGFTGFMDADGNWVQVDPVGAPVGWVSAQFLSSVPAELNVLPGEVGDLTPTISVEDQLIGDDNSVTVARAVAAQPGWVVIHRDDGGAPGAVIGHAAVDAGVSNNVVVPVDVDQATSTLHAMLHVDDGEAGVYEFPGADVPVTVNGDVVVRPFEIQPAEADFAGDVVTASTVANLNLRTGPGLGFDVIQTLPSGTVVGFTGFTDASGQWVQVDPAGGPVGWVHADFLSNVPAGLQVAEDAP